MLVFELEFDEKERVQRVQVRCLVVTTFLCRLAVTNRIEDHFRFFN